MNRRSFMSFLPNLAILSNFKNDRRLPSISNVQLEHRKHLAYTKMKLMEDAEFIRRVAKI